jgi:pre-mRNA-processing factor 40
MPPMMATQSFQAPPSSANAGSSLPPGWSEYRTPQGAAYYYNAATGVSTYDRPPTMSPVAPHPPKWMEYKDEATGAFYYFNTQTKETVWDQPEEFRMQKAREQVAKMTSEALMTAQPSPQTAPPQQAVQTPNQVPEQGSSASTEKEDEDDEEEVQRQEAQEQARKKRKQEQEREQAAQFADKPRAERMQAFKEFLEDKRVNPAMKWGDAQRTINKDAAMHNDPRWKFALSTVGEKKQAFAEYCTQAKNRATIEKRRLVKKAREEFVELLGLFEASLAPPSRRPTSWDEVSESNDFYALRKDPRWAAIPEARERQQLFATFMQDLERNQKARLAKRREALHSGFVELLRQRVASKQLELRSSKRLDSDTKRRVLELVEQVELPGSRGKIGEEALQIVDRHDVYDWSEEFLREHRELEHARRKRERAERAEREEALGRELTEKLKALAASEVLTVGSTWAEFSAEHLKDASEQQAKQAKTDDVEDEADDEEREGEDGAQLQWKAQRRVFEKVVRRLRRSLEPAAAVVRAHLDRSGDPPLRVTETTPYTVFIDALESGVGVALDTNAPEEGEEEGEEAAKTSEQPEAAVDAETEESNKGIEPEAFDAALEAAVKKQRASEDKSSLVAFPAFVRRVYDMWVAVAKEASSREEEKKLRKHRKRERKESRDLAPEEDDDEDRPRRSRRRSSADELAVDADEKSPRKRRSHRSARKRRRSHGSPSASRSRSRSRSEPRRESRRSRPNRSRSRSREREGETALPPSLAAASSKPVADTVKTEAFSPLLRPTKALTAEEEAAKAEEIIRQARLKLQVKSSSNSDDSELEEGEEPEEGEMEE